MVILYTNFDDECITLRNELDKANIEYETFTDIGHMLNLGIKSVPTLEVCGMLLNYEQSLTWIDKQTKKGEYND